MPIPVSSAIVVVEASHGPDGKGDMETYLLALEVIGVYLTLAVAVREAWRRKKK